MDNQFENKGKDQNIAQGDGAVGKQEKVKQKLRWLWNHPEVTWSGTGIYIVSLIVAAGVAVVSWHFWPEENSPPSQPNTISIAGNNSGTAVIARGNATVNNPKVALELLAKYAKELGATEQVVNGFFGTLLKKKVPRDQWDAQLREIAATHKELLKLLETVQSEDPEVQRLKSEARQAVEAGKYAEAENLLEKVAKQYSLSAAATYAEMARLQRMQLNYTKAAEYCQKAAEVLPEEEKKEKVSYLYCAAFDLHRIANYKKAIVLLEQSLVIRREIGDRAREGDTLSNIGVVYHDKGDYDTALKYLKQSLNIRREIGDRTGEDCTLDNISHIYREWGNHDKILNYLKQNLAFYRKIGDKSHEDSTLNNINLI
ncbi:MAG: tetratricopeptide repeat protein, partial [Candidatus Electrothrix sp. AR1]|nr:tetratricopeptide repeat protein [Candidatus Electrothrix sp. AR1]